MQAWPHGVCLRIRRDTTHQESPLTTGLSPQKRRTHCGEDDPAVAPELLRGEYHCEAIMLHGRDSRSFD
jgi:hypothetical protein